MTIGLPQIKDVFFQPFHRCGLAHQFLDQGRAVGQFLAQRTVVQRQAPSVAGFLCQLCHAVRVERLFQKIKRANAHRLDRHGHIAMAGDHDDRQRRIDAAQLFQELHAVHAGHFHVADDNTGEIRTNHAQRFFGAGIGFGFES